MLRRVGVAIVAGAPALLPALSAIDAHASPRAGVRAAVNGSSPYRIRSYPGCGPQPHAYLVPVGTTGVSVLARGGAGGWATVAHGGEPGLAAAAFPVIPGETLQVFAGCVGGDAPTTSTAGGAGGSGSGHGDGGGGSSLVGQGGGGGGGGSAVLRGTVRLLVAGGGGGGGGGPQDTAQGGWGGPADFSGAPGRLGASTTYPGFGASKFEPGGGGNLHSCCAGGDGVGRNGGAGGSAGTTPIGGGGGAGGWFGGGGGEGGNAPTSVGGGGGGGSSVVPDPQDGYTTLATVGHTTASRNGRVKIITMKPATGGPYWPGWDIARGVAVSAQGSGGYVLDGFGGIQPFASGNGAKPPSVTGAAYWPGWDIARGIATLADGTGGVVLDAYGGLHPFGIAGHSAPSVTGTAYWPGFDIARGIAIQPDGTSGFVIDGYGGRHAFSVNGNATPGVWGYGQTGPAWPGFDIARGISIAFQVRFENHPPVLGGYVSDAFGRIYPVGQEGPLGAKGAPTFAVPPAFGAPSWPSWAIARGIAAYPNGYGGYELDGFGGLHPFVFAGQP